MDELNIEELDIVGVERESILDICGKYIRSLPSYRRGWQDYRLARQLICIGLNCNNATVYIGKDDAEWLDDLYKITV